MENQKMTVYFFGQPLKHEPTVDQTITYKKYLKKVTVKLSNLGHTHKDHGSYVFQS